MTKRSLKYMLASGFAAVIIMAAPLGAFAQHGADDATQTGGTTTTSNSTETEHTSGSELGGGTNSQQGKPATTQVRKTEDSTHSTTEVKKPEVEHAGTGRLAEDKLKVCERRQTEITGIMQRSRERAQKQMDLFNTIATRTEAFYAAKGKTLSTYDQLVAAVNAAKSKAEADLPATQVSFTCDGNDPKGSAAAFKAALQQEIQDLKAYRTAVKNLVTGVKSVQGDS